MKTITLTNEQRRVALIFIANDSPSGFQANVTRRMLWHALARNDDTRLLMSSGDEGFMKEKVSVELGDVLSVKLLKMCQEACDSKVLNGIQKVVMLDIAAELDSDGELRLGDAHG